MSDPDVIRISAISASLALRMFDQDVKQDVTRSLQWSNLCSMACNFKPFSFSCFENVWSRCEARCYKNFKARDVIFNFNAIFMQMFDPDVWSRFSCFEYVSIPDVKQDVTRISASLALKMFDPDVICLWILQHLASQMWSFTRSVKRDAVEFTSVKRDAVEFRDRSHLDQTFSKQENDGNILRRSDILKARESHLDHILSSHLISIWISIWIADAVEFTDVKRDAVEFRDVNSQM